MTDAVRSVYLCASFARQEVMREYRRRLHAAGIAVTSRWLDMPAAAPTEVAPQAEIATVCIEDIVIADALVAFTEPYGSGYFTGGRHVELGLALAWKVPVYVIGPIENVFHCHPSVTRCAELADVVARLRLGVA